MGFPINEKITVELHWKDVSMISAALYMYQEQYKDTADEEQLNRCRDITNKLGEELFNVPDAELEDYNM